MQDSGEKWKEVVGRKVDKVANKVDRAMDADLVKAREANIRVTGLIMSKGETSKQLMELVQMELLGNCDEKYSGHKDAHSDHRPLVLIITQQWQPPPIQQKAIKNLPHFKYDIAKAAEFSWSVQHNIGVWASPDVFDASDVQTTVNLLQQCITQSVEEVFGNRQVALGKAIKHSHKPWFDTECRQTKIQFVKLSHAHRNRQVRLKQMK